MTQRSSRQGKPENEQGLRETPDPAAEAKATADEDDRTETHIPEEDTPDAAELRSAEAPGIRTESEVVEDAKIANELAAEMAAAGHTADPAVSTSAAKAPRGGDGQVWFRNKTTGFIDSVDEGSPSHETVLRDPNLELTGKPSKAEIKRQTEAQRG